MAIPNVHPPPKKIAKHLYQQTTMLFEWEKSDSWGSKFLDRSGVINKKIGSNCNQWVTTQADHPLNGLVLNVSWRTLIIETISQLE